MEGEDKKLDEEMTMMPDLVFKIGGIEARLSAVENIALQNKRTLEKMQTQLCDVNHTLKMALESLVPKVDTLTHINTLALQSENSTKCQLSKGLLGMHLAYTSSAVPKNEPITDSATTSISTLPSTSPSHAPHVPSTPSTPASSLLTKSLLNEVDNAINNGADSKSSASESPPASSVLFPKVQESFLAAADRGDTDELLRLLAKGADATLKNPAGDTPLHLSARAGHERATIVLVGAGTPVDASGSLQRTALHCAAAEGHALVVRRLLIAGAQVEAKDSEGNTALILAARNGNTQAVSELLQVSAKTRCTDDLGRTAAMWAAYNGHLEVLTLLLQEAVPTESDDDGNTALLLAAKRAHWGSVELLVHSGVPLNNNASSRAMLFALRAGKRAIVKLLSQKGSTKFPAKDYQGLKSAPLMLASENGEAEVVRDLLWHEEFTKEAVKLALMLAKDSAVVYAFKEALPSTLRGDIGEEALWRAARHGKREILEALLESGVDINAHNIYHNTALNNAAYNGHSACVDLLLGRGALKNARGNYGRTPIFDASEQGHEDCIKVLLAAGANPSTRNSGGKKPVDVAKTATIRQLLTNA